MKNARRRATRGWLACGLLAIGAATASGAEAPVRRVDVYVLPYYQSSDNAGKPPVVAVAKNYDQDLASSDPAVIRRVAQNIDREPQLITPMTLMVLAIRHYDVGLRDDAVFWFYVAKDRFLTLTDVLDVDSPALAGARDATAAFGTLAGPVINGYAFCDLRKQAAAQAKAVAWVEAHPYEALFMDRIFAKPGDRRKNLSDSIAKIKDGIAREGAYLGDPKNLETFRRTRAQRHGRQVLLEELTA